MRALLPPAFAAMMFAAHAADAKTIAVKPAECSAPPDAVVYYTPAADEATDFNRKRRIVDRVFVFYDIPLNGWASSRLFARFILDPREDLSGRLEGGCARD